MSLWAATPEPEAPRAAPTEPVAPYWWDHPPEGSAAALRHRDGRVLLMIAGDGQSWGIYQLQCCGVPVYSANSESEWELIQIRGTKADARDAAIDMAEKVGLLK